MDLSKLNEVLADQPKFRLKQVLEAVYSKLINDWREATNLSKGLQKKLAESCPLQINAQNFESKDGMTVKVLITLDDGLKIESVLMKHADKRNTVCVSTQAGCALGCAFCATGKMGFKRNLSSIEMIEQILFFARLLKSSGEKVTNVVFMGMGEPFLNYDNVLQAIKKLNDKKGFNLGGRRFSISTVGIISGIKRFADEPMEINLAISLHAANDELREKLIPSAKKYPIKNILAAVDDYIKKTNRLVMFEYVMLAGINDSERDARELAKIMRKKNYLVNLVKYNQTGEFRPSGAERMEEFKRILESARVKVTRRYSFGQDIKAACGQLAAD